MEYTTIITVSKSTGNGNGKTFFKVPMEGHHTDSVDVKTVHGSLKSKYPKPQYNITVSLLEETESIIDVED